MAGAAAGAAILAVEWAGLLQFARDWGDDELIRRLPSPIPAREDILVLAIDDASIRVLGRRPWDRVLWARVIDQLSAWGAKGILLDLTLSDPQAPRIETLLNLGESEAADFAMGPEAFTLRGQPGAGVVAEISDDRLLAEAMGGGVPVALPMYGTLKGARGNAADEAHFQDALPRGSSLESPGGALPSEATLDAWIGMLASQFDMTREQAGKQGGASEATLDAGFARAKRLAARRLASAALSQPDPPTLQTFLADMGRLFPALDPMDRQDLSRAYERESAWAQVRRQWQDLAVGGRWREATAPEAPTAVLMAGNPIVGAAHFLPGPAGAVLRRVPLISAADGKAIPLVSLALALKLMKLDSSTPERESDRVVWSTGARTALSIPVDRMGETTIPWAAEPPFPRSSWRGTFEHLSLAALMEVIQPRLAWEIALRRKLLALGHLSALRFGNEEAQGFGKTMAALREYGERALRLGPNHAPNAAPDRSMPEPSQMRDDADAAFKSLERETIDWIEWVKDGCNEVRKEESPPILCAQIGPLAELLDATSKELQRLEALKNPRTAQLKKKVEGRVCLIGVTATGDADFVSTPRESQVPGIEIHAHILNAALQNRFIRPLSARWVILLSFALILAAMAITASESALLSIFGIGALLACQAVVAALLYSRFGVLWPWGAWLVGIAATFSVGFVARSIMLQRARRQITQLLGQYTSPAIARQAAIRYHPDLLAPRLVRLTAVFTDIRGFTAISERLGPQRMRILLEAYLKIVGDTLLAHGAIVNKFMGDGVFAFFNSPLLPCEEHAAKACRAVLTCLERLREQAPQWVKELHWPENLPPPDFGFGLATGPAYVGDYGPEQKRDYTAIGDTINLASRLENANKQTGTHILVDQATKEAAAASAGWGASPAVNGGRDALFLSLGGLSLPGRSSPIQAFALMPAASALVGSSFESHAHEDVGMAPESNPSRDRNQIGKERST